MKKFSYAILLLFTAGSLFSCNNSKTADKKINASGYNPFRENFPGDVKEMTETTYKAGRVQPGTTNGLQGI